MQSDVSRQILNAVDDPDLGTTVQVSAFRIARFVALANKEAPEQLRGFTFSFRDRKITFSEPLVTLASETFRGKNAEIRCSGPVVGRWLLIEAAQDRCCAVENSCFSCTGPSSARTSLPGLNSGDVRSVFTVWQLLGLSVCNVAISYPIYISRYRSTHAPVFSQRFSALCQAAEMSVTCS
jgi:hypothetical protein